MPKNRIILFIGFFIALVPVLGFPHAWESFFQVLAGLGIVALSVMISIDKRLTLKAKAERRIRRKRAKIESEVVPLPQQDSSEQASVDTPPPANEEASAQ